MSLFSRGRVGGDGGHGSGLRRSEGEGEGSEGVLVGTESKRFKWLVNMGGSALSHASQVI